MRTLYSTYVCSGCNTTFPVAQRCPKCAPLTEERVREIAREEIRAAGGVPDRDVERIKLRDRVINDLRVHVAHLEGTQKPHRCDFVADRARDEALEEAAQVCERMLLGSACITSEAIRALKSQPAQPCISYKHPWGCEHSQPSAPRAWAMASDETLEFIGKTATEYASKQPSAEKPPVPGDGRVMSMSGWAYDKMEAESAALRRGRDDMDAERRELIAKLAAAEKALDEIATHVTHRGIAGFGIGDILKRTGRLQP